MSEGTAFRSEAVLHEVRIDASTEKVWEALTTNIDVWWHRDFLTRKENCKFVLDARPGGRLYEDWGNGEGLLWYHVVGVKKNEELRISGELFPDFGGPARMQGTWTLRADGKSTLLRLDERVFGQISDTAAASLTSGWKFLCDECLKPYVETGAINTGPADFGCG